MEFFWETDRLHVHEGLRRGAGTRVTRSHFGAIAGDYGPDTRSPGTLRFTRRSCPQVLDAPLGRVYTGDMTTPTQSLEPEPDQIIQAVAVGFCFALAAVLLVLAGVAHTRW